MAYHSTIFETNIPDTIINEIEKEFSSNLEFKQSGMYQSNNNPNLIDNNIRNSSSAWIQTNNWVAGFIWYYIQRANNENFRYDITNIDSESIQYTRYRTGEYYKWHADTGCFLYKNVVPATSHVDYVDTYIEQKIKADEDICRKLSFSLQLSNPEEYEGGELQLMTEGLQTYFAPKKRGTIIIFDSRSMHRVKKVKKGIRKSLVGWVLGPRWK